MAASTTRRRFVLGAAAVPLLARRAVAQLQFPSRTIRIVIGFPPGGGIDILARLMAPRMSERLGHPVIVENRAGANGLIATQGVAQSEPDGHTILLGTLGNLAINPVLYGARAGYDWERDFIPLSYIASLPFLLVVNAALPAKSMRELIDFAKARPGELFFGSSGNGGLPHLCGELFNLQAGVRTVHVPYRGSVPAFTDLVGGQVQFAFDAYAIAQPFIDSGRLRPLAITGPQRMAALPGVPLTKDTLPSFEVVNWYGMMVRAGTAPAIVSRLYEEVLHALRQPEVHERAGSLGLDLVGTTPEEFATFQRMEVAKWAEVIRTAKIQID
jgi:tripartite-type tricarboxylate transporter receptor subunit TctC